MSDKVISSTTQEFLDVYDIVNDMVLLKDGSAAIILQVGTMNFSLLAEQEQDAVIFTYGSLLNSLNYPIQINIQSQTKDATKYLRLLDEQVMKASSDRKAALIKQYRGFVEGLIKERNVLQKRFYIVAPATPGEIGIITPSSVLPGQGAISAESVEKSVLLEKATNVLDPRRDHLTAQFNRLGLFARQLSTQEIIQNFYINYNPEAAEGQEISSSENYTTPLVRASFGGKFMQLNTIMQNQAGQVQDAAQIPTEMNAQQPQVQSVAPVAMSTPPAPASADPIPTPEEILGQSENISAAMPQAQVFPPVSEQVDTSMQTAPIPEMQQTPSVVEEQPSLDLPSTLEQTLPSEQAVVDQTAPPVQAPEINLSLDPSLLNTQASIVETPDMMAGFPATNQPEPAPSIEQTAVDQVLPQVQPVEVFAESTTEEQTDPAIPQIETAPIVVENQAPATEVVENQTSDSVPSPDQSAESTPPVDASMPDFAEEIAPLQIQDEPKLINQ